MAEEIKTLTDKTESAAKVLSTHSLEIKSVKEIATEQVGEIKN
jgi:hypothetical protein